jgi:ADP-heptose:LPS heptosyltransferase
MRVFAQITYLVCPGLGRRVPVTGDGVRMRVLILRALGLGDFLVGVPAYRAVRAAHPEHEVILAAPAALSPLVRLTGAIDGVLAARELQPLEWAGPPPEVAVDLHGSGPASHRVVEALGAGLTMMYASSEAPGAIGPWWDPSEHEVDRWCRLPAWYGIPADSGDLGLAPPGPVHDSGLAGRAALSGAAVLHPGAASRSRRWPAERFSVVARGLVGEGHRVVITGTAAERDLRRRVAEGAGLAAGAVLDTDLLGLAALVASASVVVTNDTGISHLATAYGTPSVTLFGPVSPGLWGPPRDRPHHVALWHGTGDRPGDAHGQVPDPRLLKITVEEVLAAVSAAIRQPRGVRRTI